MRNSHPSLDIRHVDLRTSGFYDHIWAVYQSVELQSLLLSPLLRGHISCGPDDAPLMDVPLQSYCLLQKHLPQLLMSRKVIYFRSHKSRFTFISGLKMI